MKPRQPILFITLDRTCTRWRSLEKKLQTVEAELNTMKGASFFIDVEHRDLAPAVYQGRITHEWMDSISHAEHKRGYDFVAIHMSNGQRQGWGIKPRGSYHEDTDLIHECYFWADENTRRAGYNQFEQTFLHELRHGLVRGMGLPDDTHQVHEDGDIRGSFAHLYMDDYSPLARNLERQVSLLQKTLDLLKRMTNLKPTLYQVATSYIGKDASPRDLASDVVGCAESVSTILRDVLPTFPIITGTYTLWQMLEQDHRFKRVTIPMPGTIIISPTGTSTSKVVRNGHVGIFGEAEKIMSNDSNNGLWQQNYTLTSWRERWGKAGYPLYMYQLTS